ncbi:hypothetical protein Scep_017176 [Stephania cephalantha]|uniref:Uncharacterized protein n=1 Tax=Stephania cephalantha TaxID=152367 RepID=A0AAP0IP13_9MAGN
MGWRRKPRRSWLICDYEESRPNLKLVGQGTPSQLIRDDFNLLIFQYIHVFKELLNCLQPIEKILDMEMVVKERNINFYLVVYWISSLMVRVLAWNHRIFIVRIRFREEPEGTKIRVTLEATVSVATTYHLRDSMEGPLSRRVLQPA